MRMRPLVGSSSPAIRLSVVDLPQPEGPTNERNSPSAISSDSSRSASGPPEKALRTRSRETLATLFLHHARRRLTTAVAGAYGPHSFALGAGKAGTFLRESCVADAA